MDKKEKLRNEYRKTWEMFSLRMKKAQSLAESAATPAEVAVAMREAELALAAHKEARNLLAALLAPEKLSLVAALSSRPVVDCCAGVAA